MESFVYLSCLLRELWSLKRQKWFIFSIFCCWQHKISHSSGKIFRFIWKILFSSFRKWYGLLGSELPLARCHCASYMIWIWRRYECIKSLEHHKPLKTLQTDRSFVMFYLSSRQICSALKDELCFWAQRLLSAGFRIRIIQFAIQTS